MASILIVDDHADLCRPLTRLFRIDGHAADFALSGEEALNKMGAGMVLPDVLLLDFMMPGMDGLEVLRRVRENPRTAAVPVVMYTAVGDQQFASHAMAKGANGYVVKGTVDFPALKTRLSEYLAS